MKFHIKREKRKKRLGDKMTKGFYYVLKGRNGEVMLTSEVMVNKRSCTRSIESIKAGINADTETVDETLKKK
jgi:uncharacterized protein YegP (UPF0339 family)